MSGALVCFEPGVVDLSYRPKTKEGTVLFVDGVLPGPGRGFLNCGRAYYACDHHGVGERWALLSSCEQVWRLMGYGVRFSEIIWNDLDADTALSIFIALRPDKLDNKRLKELLDSIGVIDAMGPGHSFISRHPMHILLTAKDQSRFSNDALWEALAQIDRFIEGWNPILPHYSAPQKIAIYENGDMELIHGGMMSVYGRGRDCAVLIDSLDSRWASVAQSPVRLEKGETWTYRVLKALSHAEGYEIGTTLGWGPNSTSTPVGGSPRPGGTKLNPSQIAQIIRRL